MSRNRRRAYSNTIGCLPLMIGLLSVAAIALALAIFFTGRYTATEDELVVQDVGSGKYVDVSNVDAEENQLVLNAASYDASASGAEIVVTPTPSPAPLPTLSTVSKKTLANLAPTPTADGFLPIYKRADTDEMAIAITVDECNGVTITKKIALLARYYGAKLTLFPTGDNLNRKGMASVLRICLNKLGFELENRGYDTISQIYRMSNDKMCEQIWKQTIQLENVLGVRYQPHFLRLYGGNGENDLRTHGYLKQLGYYGIASYTYNGNAMSSKQLVKTLAPGNIYMFKSTAKDAKKISALMKAAKAGGYQMVTMNTLFGYAKNATRKITTNILLETMPTLGDYNNHFYFMKKGDCTWAVYQLQKRLEYLGYLHPGSADGVFGKSTAVVLSAFQAKCGLAATGAADVVTQERLYAKDAPVAEGTPVPNNPTPSPEPEPEEEDALQEEADLLESEEMQDGDEIFDEVEMMEEEELRQ